ncbi:hypothetical protein JCGZ_27038 [Jatropha curcas]|uniref:Aminotransferase-like plant mobile domain-containing protein n=1 Tax=Jatropha curcas TaxID=180498 RepID=A0A067JVJ2_JATCU|nr:hypothetical protein JCGZ_27038 [Jatropha curcas]
MACDIACGMRHFEACLATLQPCGLLYSTSGRRHFSSVLCHYSVACDIVAISTKREKVCGNAYVADEWFDRLPVRVQDCIWEAAFYHFLNTLPRVRGQTLPSSILALMGQWMDTTHTFHLAFGEMTMTPVNFTAIIGLLFGGQSVVFDDLMRTLDCASLPDFEVTRQFNWGVAALSYLYYGTDLCVGGAHLKVGYRRVTESRLVSTESSPCRAYMALRATLIEVSKGDVADYPNFIQSAVGYQHKWLLLLSLFYDMFYLGERVYKWELGPDQRGVPHDVPYYMLSTRSIRLEQDIVASRRGLATIDLLVAFMLSAYAIFVRTQLLVHMPPPIEFDPFIERQQRSKRVRRGSDSGAPDTAVVLTSQSMDRVLLSLSSWTTRVKQHRVSISDYIKVCQLYEAACPKLAVVRLSDEHISNIWVQPGLLQWLINHFDPSDNLLHHNDFEIYLLFEEFNIISGRIPVVKEVPVAYSEVGADSESTDLLTARFLLGPDI